MVGLYCQDDRVAWPHRIWNGFDATFIRTPLELIANDCQFSLTHVFGEFGN
jgi:hypothetical protein